MTEKSFCRNYNRVAIGTDKNTQHGIVTRLRCKKWSCAHCADINRRQWQRRLIEGIKAIGMDAEWSFWTFTHDLPAETPYEQQRKHLSQCFNRFMTRFKRIVDSERHYVRVIEIGTQGTKRMHLHMLIDFTPPIEMVEQRSGDTYGYNEYWFSEIRRAGFGMIADIRDVSARIQSVSELTEMAAYVSSYVSKYMTKLSEETDDLYPAYTRRFNLSRNWPVAPHEDGYADGENWTVVQQLTVDHITPYWSRGRDVFDVDRDREIEFSDIQNGIVLLDHDPWETF